MMTPGAGVAEEPSWQENAGSRGVKSGTPARGLGASPPGGASPALLFRGASPAAVSPGPWGVFLPNLLASQVQRREGRNRPGQPPSVFMMFHFLILTGPGFGGHRATG